MLSRLSRDLNEITEKEQIMNSEQCSELDTTSTAMMLFNNGYVVIIMDTSSMMDNMSHMNSIYCYFSSMFEVSVLK